MMQDLIKIVLPIAIVHLAVLAGIVLVVRKLLQGDTAKAVVRLRQVEAEVRKKEENIRQEIEEHEKEFLQKKNEAEAALQEQRKASEKEVAKMRDQVVAEARKEAERITDQAKRNEEKLRQQIAQDMEEKAVDYGTEVFKLVFSEKMNEAIDREFINELLDALDEIDAGSMTVDTADASFVCRHPLPEDQKQRLQSLLKEKFGAEVTVQETVDESLIGGMIFKLGSLEIDGSLVNRFREATAEVKKSAHV